MNELVEIQQKCNDYTTKIKVDSSVKKLTVEWDGTCTKVTKVIVEIKENNIE